MLENQFVPIIALWYSARFLNKDIPSLAVSYCQIENAGLSQIIEQNGYYYFIP